MPENADTTGNLKWKCNGCGYTFQADTPPDQCPSCREDCGFVDVTCYTPECDFRGFDTRLGRD